MPSFLPPVSEKIHPRCVLRLAATFLFLAWSSIGQKPRRSPPTLTSRRQIQPFGSWSFTHKRIGPSPSNVGSFHRAHRPRANRTLLKSVRLTTYSISAVTDESPP